MPNEAKPDESKVRRYTERFLASLLRREQTTLQISSADPLAEGDESAPEGLTNRELIDCLKQRAGLDADPEAPHALGQLRVEEEGTAGTVLLSCEQLPDNEARLVLSVLHEKNPTPSSDAEVEADSSSASPQDLSGLILSGAADAETLHAVLEPLPPAARKELAFDLQAFAADLTRAERWSYLGPAGVREQGLVLSDPQSQNWRAWLRLDDALAAEGTVGFLLLRAQERWQIELRPAPEATLESLAASLNEAEPEEGAASWQLEQDGCQLGSPDQGSALPGPELAGLCRSWLQAVPLEAERLRRAAELLNDWPQILPAWTQPQYEGRSGPYLRVRAWREGEPRLILLRSGAGGPQTAVSNPPWLPVEQLATEPWRGNPVEAWATPLSNLQNLRCWRAEQTQLPVAALLAVLRDLARCLATLHQDDRGHGGVHPHNIWLSRGPAARERTWLLAPGCSLSTALERQVFSGAVASPVEDARCLADLCLFLVCGEARTIERADQIGEALQPALLGDRVSGVRSAWYGDLEELLRGMLEESTEAQSVRSFVRSLEESAERWESDAPTDTWRLDTEQRTAFTRDASDVAAPAAKADEREELAFLRNAVEGLEVFGDDDEDEEDEEEDEDDAKPGPALWMAIARKPEPGEQDRESELEPDEDMDRDTEVIVQAWEALGFDDDDDEDEPETGEVAGLSDEAGPAAQTEQAEEAALDEQAGEEEPAENGAEKAAKLSLAGLGSSVFTPEPLLAVQTSADAPIGALVDERAPQPESDAARPAVAEAEAEEQEADTRPSSGASIRSCLKELPRHEGYKLLAGCALSKRLVRRGGAAVFRGTELASKKRVLLTLLAPDFQDSRAAMRFLARAERFLPMKHPNLLRVVKTGNEAGLAFIVQRRVRHLTAFDLVASIRGKERLGMAELPALVVVESIARGLAAMHEQRLLHAKVHPGRILIPAREHEKRLSRKDYLRELRDTKLALISLTLEEWKPSGDAVSWRSFLAPERRGEGRLAPSADVYSLGAVLFFLLTGRAPMKQPKGAEASPSYLPLYQLRPEVSMEIGGLLARCLQRDPNSRFKNGRALQKALEKVRRSLEKG